MMRILLGDDWWLISADPGGRCCWNGNCPERITYIVKITFKHGTQNVYGLCGEHFTSLIQDSKTITATYKVVGMT